MRRRVLAILVAVMCISFCACTKDSQCVCECGCEECSCTKKKPEKEPVEEKKEFTQEELETLAGDKEYKGTLRRDGVIIGNISEDQTTMQVYHRGGVWTLDYVGEYKKQDSVGAVIADNETPDDYSDDIFVSFCE